MTRRSCVGPWPRSRRPERAPRRPGSGASSAGSRRTRRCSRKACACCARSAISPRSTGTASGGPAARRGRSAQACGGGRVVQSVEVAGAVELDERLASAAGAHLTVGDEGMSGERAAIACLARSARPLRLTGADTDDDPGGPLGALLIVLPEIHGRPGERFSRERHVDQGKSLVPSGHRVNGNRVSAHGHRRAARARAVRARPGRAPSTRPAIARESTRPRP